MDLFERMPVVSKNPLSLLGQVKDSSKCWLDVGKFKTQVLTTRDDSRRTGHARQMHSTDYPDAEDSTKIGWCILRNLCPCSHRSISRDTSLRSLIMASMRVAHMSRDEVMDRLVQLGWEPTSERGVHTSGKEEYTARTRGEDDEVRDERQHKRMRRSESKEQNRAARRVQGTQYPRCPGARQNRS